MPHPATPALLNADQTPVALTSVHPSEQGWIGRLQARNASVTLPHVIAQLDETSLLNLRNVRDGVEAAHIGNPNSDSEVHMVLEAVAWEAARTGSTEFDSFVDETIELLAAVQADDGYLNSWGQQNAAYEHFSDAAMGQELFTGSHLLKTAVVLNRLGRGDAIMTIATKWADLVVENFGPGKDGYDGFPGVEGALVEFYRETGEKKYLDTAVALLDRRGQGRLHYGPLGPIFFQDHEPVRDAIEALGHASRQQYLDASVADVYAETRDEALEKALVARWESTHLTKLYITGGLGSRHFDESFGAPYELPASRAYCETAASVADIYVNHRLLLLSGGSRYADAIEKVMYNMLPAAVGTDGTSFFSSNPLQVRSRQRDETNNRIARAPWVTHSTSPTSLTRIIASLGAHVATTHDRTLSIQQWFDGSIDLPENIGEGKLVIETNYPASGSIRIRLEGTAVAGARLRMRVPNWCEKHSFNGRSAIVVDGYYDQPLTDDFDVMIEFQMPARFVYAHPRVDAVRGCRAVLRGPVVYCAEGVDNPQIENLVFDTTAEVGEVAEGELLPKISVPARFRRKPQALYMRTMVAVDPEVRTATLVPYGTWGNRGSSPMRVWLPTE